MKDVTAEDYGTCDCCRAEEVGLIRRERTGERFCGPCWRDVIAAPMSERVKQSWGKDPRPNHERDLSMQGMEVRER